MSETAKPSDAMVRAKEALRNYDDGKTRKGWAPVGSYALSCIAALRYLVDEPAQGVGDELDTDPDGHYELGMRIAILDAKETDLAWAAWAEKLLADAKAHRNCPAPPEPEPTKETDRG